MLGSMTMIPAGVAGCGRFRWQRVGFMGLATGWLGFGSEFGGCYCSIETGLASVTKIGVALPRGWLHVRWRVTMKWMSGTPSTDLGSGYVMVSPSVQLRAWDLLTRL